MNRETLHACLIRAAEVGRPVDGFRFLDRHERETWRDFQSVRDQAARIATGLVAQGVRKGDRVGIVMPTCPEFIDLFFACHWIGAVPTPLYPPVRLGRLDEYFNRTAAMLAAAEVVLLVHESRVGKLLGNVLSRYTPPLGMLDVTRLVAASAMEPTPPGPDDLALVQFSSGTTTTPKPVALTHAQVLANAEAILDFLPADSPIEQCGVSWLPLYHDMGLIGCIVPAVHRPGPLTLIPPEIFLAKPAIWLRAISRYRATASPAPNFAFSLCVDRIRDEDLEGCDLSSWLLALNGAEPIAPGTIRDFQRRFEPWGLRPEAITPVYGLSEAALAVTFGDVRRPFRAQRFDRDALSKGRAQPADEGVELASVGRPLRGFEVQVRHPDNTPVESGEIGTIWVQGPSLMAGYLNGPTSPIVDGWLDTGDLGFILDGELYVTGRAKDVLIIRGRNHAPQDLEAAVDQVPGVRTGCAAAVADVGEEGERILVFVEHRGDPRPTLAIDCEAAIRSATGIAPDLVVVLEGGTLPRTSSGKIRRSEALRRFQTDSLDAPEKITTWLLAGAMARSSWNRMTQKATERA